DSAMDARETAKGILRSVGMLGLARSGRSRLIGLRQDAYLRRLLPLYARPMFDAHKHEAWWTKEQARYRQTGRERFDGDRAAVRHALFPGSVQAADPIVAQAMAALDDVAAPVAASRAAAGGVEDARVAAA